MLAVAGLVGMVYRVLLWAGAPVPFRIPTVSGQQKSLPWIEQDKLESPSNGLQVIGRMALEVLLFRSLFRNTRIAMTPAHRVVYQSDKFLWAADFVSKPFSMGQLRARLEKRHEFAKIIGKSKPIEGFSRKTLWEKVKQYRISVE